MFETPTPQPLFDHIQVRGQEFFWTCQEGLDPAVVETVEGFIWATARRLQVPAALEGIPLEDLVQEGRIGALVASQRFEPSKAASFLAYASKWIYQRMAAALENGGHLRIPERRKEALRKAGQLPGIVSLDQTLPSGEGTIGDLIPDVGATGREEGAFAANQIRDLVQVLPSREQEIIRRHYGFDGEEESLPVIAKDLGLGAERVRQLHLQAIRKLAKAVKA